MKPLKTNFLIYTSGNKMTVGITGKIKLDGG